MEDEKIIELYNARNEFAITETERKFGKMLFAIAMNILSNKEDSEETVNDTYGKAWNSIPPQVPNSLGAWLGRITRNLSITRWRMNKAQKRSGMEIMLSELEECIPSAADTESESESGEITAAINRWLGSLKKEERLLFVRRYWYGDSVADLAKKANILPKKLSSKMFRLRKSLKDSLEKEGISL
ncbi:MAG: sigma-70 family RNA polymerase sigma factor [Oscillospiraceae bacterium]|nr:sigma-70 family RNA polymerase sigma factor [Oscillospiraceae bacterium]